MGRKKTDGYFRRSLSLNSQTKPGDFFWPVWVDQEDEWFENL
jgi:hypothetical protein